MARQIGSTFTGTVDGLTFYYDRVHGYLVRQTGGVTSKQYHKDKRYAAARDASSEFSNVSRAGKLIREALGGYVQQIKDGTMVNRLNKELVFLKQRDNTHFRGGRRPEVKMADDKTNLYFRIFQFNEGAKLYELTEQFPRAEQQAGQLFVHDLRLKQSAFPEGATHAGLTLIWTVIDFERGVYRTDASRMAVVPANDLQTVSLSLTPTDFTGIEIVCLQVVFFREQDGDLLQVKEKVHSMGIVSVNYQCGNSSNYQGKPSSEVSAETICNKGSQTQKDVRDQSRTHPICNSYRKIRRRRWKRGYQLALRGKDQCIYTDERGEYFVFRGEGKERRRVLIDEPEDPFTLRGIKH